jgi:hypothetical protein
MKPMTMVSLQWQSQYALVNEIAENRLKTKDISLQIEEVKQVTDEISLKRKMFHFSGYLSHKFTL